MSRMAASVLCIMLSLRYLYPFVPLWDYDDFYPFYPTCAEFTPPYFAIRQIDKLCFCQQIPLFLCGIRYRMISSEYSQRLTDAGESATMKAQKRLVSFGWGSYFFVWFMYAIKTVILTILGITEWLSYFCTESSIEWFQRNALLDLTIPHKSAKIYLHKGTADRRLVRFITCKNSRKVFQTKGGYFCGLLLSLLPMAYPRPKQVRHKPSTEINPSIVNIHSALLSQIPASRFLCNRRVTVPPQKN